jgi:hypothetical protein
LDLAAVHIAIEAEARYGEADLQVVMGNHIVPLVQAHGRVIRFHCQFPFPMPKPPAGSQRKALECYDRIIVNSRFTALHVEASPNGPQLQDPKRQDLVIKAFKALAERSRLSVELHLAGSSHPAPENMAYLAGLMLLAVERRARLSDAAKLRAGAFSVEAFADKLGLLLAELKATAI